MTDARRQDQRQNGVLAALPGVVMRRVRGMERRVLLSGLLALIVALLLLTLILFGPVEARFGAAVGLFGLLIGLQLAVLFFRPTDRSAFGMARQAFAEGQFEAAAQQIEALIGSPANKPDPRLLILLGNSYRQLGRLADSRAQLTRALQIGPRQPSALYGLGRTVLAEGDFDAAADWFDQALAAGAPSVIGCELGLAEYLAGHKTEAITLLQKLTRRLQIESYRAWLVNGLLLITISPESAAVTTLRANIKLNADGRAYWQADADRHHATSYGQRLLALLGQIDELLSLLEVPSKEGGSIK